MEVLLRLSEVLSRLHTIQLHSMILYGAMGILAFFGLLNCLLGYRLLRFWMMLGGFALGAVAGYFAANTFGVEDTTYLAVAAIVCGVLTAIITFLIFKIGIFAIGAAIGLIVSIYVLHPTSSSVFFVCILVGVGLGTLTAKFSREVIIVSTGVLGGAMSGVAVAKLAGLAEFPYGVGMSIGFAVLGILVQFATNKPAAADDEDDEDDEDEKVTDQAEESDESEIYETEVDETWQKKQRLTR
jgi:hypothetical protein